MFPDDLILAFRANTIYYSSVYRILDICKGLINIHINVSKSNIYLLNVYPSNIIHEMCNIFRINEGTWLFKYLGTYIGFGRIPKKF